MPACYFKNYAKIDLSALVSNYRLLLARAQSFDPEAKPICVVKADAYGHGVRECVAALSRAGADFFAVSDVTEAIEIREVNESAKILILGYSKPENAPVLCKRNIIQTVHSYEYARELDEALSGKNVKLSVHIKLDSGMSRLGFSVKDDLDSALDEIASLAALPHINAEGVFSHFACADEPESPMTDKQLSLFNSAVEAMRARGLSLCSHISNSAAAIRFGAAGHNYFRLGISLYGYAPSEEMSCEGLLPVMSLYSAVAQVSSLKKGECVSYGATFCADRDMRVATVSIGYADGLIRACSGASLLINGKKAKILGRVCMDQCVVCVDGIDVREGDKVTVYDESGENLLAIASHLQTISYELLCLVGKRVPRIYKDIIKE